MKFGSGWSLFNTNSTLKKNQKNAKLRTYSRKNFQVQKINMIFIGKKIKNIHKTSRIFYLTP
jgi:hypothetical protein